MNTKRIIALTLLATTLSPLSVTFAETHMVKPVDPAISAGAMMQKEEMMTKPMEKKDKMMTRKDKMMKAKMMKEKAMKMKKEKAMMQMKKDKAMMKDDANKAMIIDDTAMMKSEVNKDMMKKDSMMTTGSYEAYAPEKLMKYADKKIVLFFRASWCPTCKTVDADIRANMKSIPADVVILDVNYDDSRELQAKYGVTYQHTFVQVDKLGTNITKWSGGSTLASIIAKLKNLNEMI